jgi:SAM-dependent methyltransferase
VTGIDLDVVSTKYNIKKYIEIWQRNGLERMFKTFMGRILVQRDYYFYLKEACNSPLKFVDLDLRQMDVTNLSFDDEEFDIVISNAVFEHIQDVPRAVRELKRVMKKGAITYHLIHLFTSLSGGHNLNWANPDEYVPKNIPPWDHLRKKLFPAHVYLNKLRMKDYIQIFENNSTILECKVGKTEGKSLLTPGIKKELSEYSEEELIARDLIIVAKK